ncbi:hypothetical protein V7793_25140 [Streptomyces sp. KLMMK]|uniref:hypothetical protein n=1 Tax=Streptomyces sp. KLMMK TaxID=3109353 RepID=UPI00300BEB53
MGKWLVISEQTVMADGAPPQQWIEVLRTLPGSKSRDEALVALRNEAKKYKPACLKGASRVVGQDSDGSFWILPKNGAGHARCNVRLIEQVHP